MNELLKKYFIIFFFIGIIILVPLIGLFSTNQTVSIQENRNLATWPNFLDHGYFEKIDDYLNDHFGCREIFIKLHHAVKKTFLKKKGAFKAIMGKNDWAFFEGSVDHYQGKIDEARIDAFIQNIRDLHIKFPNIPMVIIVIPNKTFIYSQHLPDYVVSNPQRFNTISKLKSLERMHILDLYSVLKNTEEKVFLKNDTHWNGVGAYIAYKAIIEFINENTSFDFDIKEDIKEILVKEAQVGDITGMLGVQNVCVDENNIVVFEESSVIVHQKPDFEGLHIPDYTNQNGSGRIMLIHDSFAQAKLAEYLAESFQEIKTFWGFAFKGYEKEIEKINPDLILIEMVDRHIQ